MENQSPIKSPPLHQVSPERMNQLRIPYSPSLNSFFGENEKHSNRDSISSDVQGKIALLNNLSLQQSPTHRPRTLPSAPSNHALQRAVLGYEEAQATLATITAENERLKMSLESAKKRERVTAQRIESLMEELAADREKRNSDKETYVKEIKRCRKETYRAELAQVEVREELKEARNELKRAQAEIANERVEKEQAKQEAFERAYALQGAIGETEELRDKLKVIQKERDAALVEVNSGVLREKELTREIIQADLRKVQHDLETHKSHKSKVSRQEDPDATPKASIKHSTFSKTQRHELLNGDDSDFKTVLAKMSLFEKDIEGEELSLEDKLILLRQELSWAKRKHEEDADVIHFMHMQCHFKACPCRLAEADGKKFVHDHAYEQYIEGQHIAKKRKIEEDNKFKQLPPDPTPEMLLQLPEDQTNIDEAAQVPLPSPKEMEFESQVPTPERTAQLEEITQVIIAPTTGVQPFSFSTSTSSHILAPPSNTPSLQRSQIVLDNTEQDLFNLSPPKNHPPRPSTAMGVLTMESPMKLVADSPQSSPGSTLTQTPDRYSPKTQTISTTSRIALKGSPERSHRRSQSRPNIRSQSRARSPLVVNALNSVDLPMTSAGSPASSTVFPVTPVIKHARSMHVLSPQAQEDPRQISTTTTTTMVPVRGLDSDDVFSPERAHTTANIVTTQDQTALLPGTPVSREAALEQIRARRDRARSLNMKNAAAGTKSLPGSAKRGLTLRDALGGVERGREISQASAPGRIFM